MKAPTRYSLLCTALLVFSSASTAAHEATLLSVLRNGCIDGMLILLSCNIGKLALMGVAHTTDINQKDEFIEMAERGGILMSAAYGLLSLPAFCYGSSPLKSMDNWLGSCLVSIPLCYLTIGGILLLKRKWFEQDGKIL